MALRTSRMLPPLSGTFKPFICVLPRTMVLIITITNPKRFLFPTSIFLVQGKNGVISIDKFGQLLNDGEQVRRNDS